MSRARAALVVDDGLVGFEIEVAQPRAQGDRRRSGTSWPSTGRTSAGSAVDALARLLPEIAAPRRTGPGPRSATGRDRWPRSRPAPTTGGRSRGPDSRTAEAAQADRALSGSGRSGRRRPRGSSFTTTNEAGLCPPAVGQSRWTTVSFSNGYGPNQARSACRMARRLVEQGPARQPDVGGDRRPRPGPARRVAVADERSSRPTRNDRYLTGVLGLETEEGVADLVQGGDPAQESTVPLLLGRRRCATQEIPGRDD